jgi:Fe-S cluster assembly iron-binding protein IscA
MALDELKDTDDLFEIDGFKYIVNKDFIEKAKPIKVDYQVQGFKLDCGIDFGSSCKSCETTESGCC